MHQQPTPVRFKGSPYVFKRRQPIEDPQPTSTSEPNQGMKFIQQPKFSQQLGSIPSVSVLPNPEPSDLDLSIAIRKLEHVQNTP